MTEEKQKDESTQQQQPVPEELPEPIARQHEVKAKGRNLKYTTTVGKLPVRNEQGEVQANLFFTAYTLDDPKATEPRPLTFTFNGGPGSSSVWLHLGGLAPKRVELLDDGGMPQPPYRLVDNEYTWLESTDMVFIDPVDTGYSRATSEDAGKAAKDAQGDLESIGEFIRLYLARYGRWTSPLFMAGESYGTFRSAGLAGYLIEKGIAFNGIILISSILNMQTARAAPGNDLPYSLFFPTYAATAWFHGKVAKDLQKKKVRDFLDEVEAWVEEVYAPALALGDRLTGKRREEVLDGLERYSGLSRSYLEQTNLRILIHQFCKELLRDEGRTVGRLDSRFKGYDRNGATATPDYDPSMNAIRPPFTTTLNHYLRQELGYETDDEYHILRGLEWTYGDAARGYADMSDALRSAFAKNPYMHMFVASGYYDLATPYYATMYTLDHSEIPAEMKSNFQLEEYPVGHMVYVENEALKKLRDDIERFIARAVAR